jgi:hypothetical protein
MAGDYMSSATRMSGTRTIQDVRLHTAFSEGQRDAEQGWPANARMWEFTGALAAAYHAGYCQPRTRKADDHA